jgi:sulfur-carrier protein
MSITVRLPGPLRELADGLASIELDGRVHTAGDVLDALRREYPGVYDRIMTEQGDVRPHVNVFVGNEAIRSSDGLATRVDDGAEVVILPAVSGG